ncbi:MAG: hypothetical protein HY921_06145 [Elusimicrobia bacterium]|nr:hypothetical protein [Elusimicrobiota bacterium]
MESDEAVKTARPPAEPGSSKKILVLLMASGAALLGLAVFVLLAPRPGGDKPSAASAPQSESAFIGSYGYVVRLPKGYSASQGFKENQRSVEIVHFCKKGTDPSNFIHEGLYGPLGIVRMDVHPSPFAEDLNGLEVLSRILKSRIQARGEKFSLKNLPVSSMRAIQINYEAPFPRVEAYILGHKLLYSFTAGQDDDVFHEIIQGLRDEQSEL